MKTRLFFILSWAAFVAAVPASPRLAGVFGDHVVLQRDRPIPVWGFGARPGQELGLRFDGISIPARIEASGRWRADLPAQTATAAGGNLSLLLDGQEVDVARDVVVGEVWLAAGQSNMQFPVRGMLKGLPETQPWVDACDLPAVRFRRVNDPVPARRGAEASDLASREAWRPMSPKTVPGFSAVAAVYARRLHEALNVPIGVIDVSWGGKPIEPFIPREAFTGSTLRRILQRADADDLDALAKLEGGVIIRNPEGHPGAIFNGRMAPVVPFALRGFLWYQAESNCGRGEDPRDYRHKMKAMIEGWRACWDADDLPVYFVQLPSFPFATGWIRMREEQRRAQAIPHSSMAVTFDVRGEGIHPPDKLSVGRRLAGLALARTYGRNTGAAVGPAYESHRVEGNQLRVHFANADAGLMVGDKPGLGPAKEIDVPLRWFEVAGRDGVWHPATARIQGSEVIVASDAVAQPVEVRYACHVQPQGGNLYGRNGLPASPFCSKLEWLPWEDHGAKP